jgi:hypothetical protein
MRQGTVEIETFRVKLADLAARMDAANGEMRDAKNQAERDAAAAKQAAIREQQRQVKADIAVRRQQLAPKASSPRP